jgi:DNA-binding GntR family transcriptional regulator
MSGKDTSSSSQGQAAYARMLEEIRQGVLGPGARLRETELAARFGISRTPIREAIRQLEADGLVVHVAHFGAAVRSLDYAEVMELYEMRAVLEATAARMAALAASEIELEELEAINAEMRAASENPGLAYSLNRQFHTTLLDAARNRFLVKSAAAMEKTLLILGRSTLSDPMRVQEAADEHARLTAALRSRDPALAEREMRAHVEGAQRIRMRHLRDANRDHHTEEG